MHNKLYSRYARIANCFSRALPYFASTVLNKSEETKRKYYDSELVFLARHPDKLIIVKIR